MVLEDVPAGVRSGKSAGSRVAAFTTTVGKADLLAAGADWVLKGCADIRLVDGLQNLKLGFVQS